MSFILSICPLVNITITASSGLSDNDIDKMVADAEAHEEEDTKRRDAIVPRQKMILPDQIGGFLPEHLYAAFFHGARRHPQHVKSDLCLATIGQCHRPAQMDRWLPWQDILAVLADLTQL